MEADIREVVADLETTADEPGDMLAEHIGEEWETARQEEGPLTDFQIGMIGGGLIGFAAGMVTAALIVMSRRKESREEKVEIIN